MTDPMHKTTSVRIREEADVIQFAEETDHWLDLSEVREVTRVPLEEKRSENLDETAEWACVYFRHGGNCYVKAHASEIARLVNDYRKARWFVQGG